MGKVLQRILYIEDEPDIQRVVKLALEALGGFTVELCGSGAEAVERAPALAPDLILLDVMMPEMDGPTVLHLLRQLPGLATTPVIFMTAKVQPDEIEHFKAMGALAVIAKPFDPMALVETVRNAWEGIEAKPSGANASFTERMAALGAQFRAELPRRVADLQSQWGELEHLWSRGALAPDVMPEDVPALAELHRIAHNLAGSGSTFGFEAITVQARVVDTLLKTLARHQVQLNAAFWAELGRAHSALLDALRIAQIGTGGDASGAPSSAPETAPASNTAGKTANHQPEPPLIYLVGTGPASAALESHLNSFGYRAEMLTDADSLEKAVASVRPAAVLFDNRTSFSDPFERVEALHARNIPVFVINDDDDFATRLRAVRSGIAGFYRAPVDMLALLARLDQQTSRQPYEPYRVLLVDDERADADYHATLLRRAGVVTHCVHSADAVLPCLEEFAPDVIVADMYMPGVSGVELAMVVRQQERYDHIPIVFLSAERDIGKQKSALDMGADDFLMKPVAPDYFVSALSARAHRARALRAAMTHDGLTALLNHKNIKALLEKEFARSQRTGTALSVALIDIDSFKQINDRHGHATGDQVLRALARLLQQRLRASDYVGRCGGEEFLLILPDTDGGHAHVLLDELRAAFGQLRHRSEQGAFSATFSAGVAQAGTFTSAAMLFNAADKALYAAKDGGRDRVQSAAD